MKIYIPKKHYKSFWKEKLYTRAYGGKSSLVDLLLTITGGKIVVEQGVLPPTLSKNFLGSKY